MKVAYIYSEKRISTGAHFINDLIAKKLQEKKIEVASFYPKFKLLNPPLHLKGLSSILFFFSLLERRGEILRYDIIQGTTYTILPFLNFYKTTIAHFGSTTEGFLKAVPQAKNLDETKEIWYKLRAQNILSELNIKSRRPIKDIAEIEHYVASKASAVIATSEIVKQNLVSAGIDEEKVFIIYNSIEDYWFKSKPKSVCKDLKIVFLGRIGNDVFTYKLKGLDRILHLFVSLPNFNKVMISMMQNKKLINWLKTNINNLDLHLNVKKVLIPEILNDLYGCVLFIPSRYEGFSLSLIEGMSQGLIPVSYPIGVAPEIIKNGENGFLVNNQKEAIKYIKLLNKDQKLREIIAENSYRTALNFKSDQMAENFIKLYKQLLKRKRAAVNKR